MNSRKESIHIVKLGDDYSVGLGNYFKIAFENLGGTVVEEHSGRQQYSIPTTVNEKADVIFAPTSTEAASLIIGRLFHKV